MVGASNRFNKHMTSIGKNCWSRKVWRGIREYRPMIEGYTDIQISSSVSWFWWFFSFFLKWFTPRQQVWSHQCGFSTESSAKNWYGRPEFLSVTTRDLRPLQHVMAVSFIWSQVMSTYVYNMDKAVRRLEGTEWGFFCSEPMDPHGMIWPLGSLGVAGSLLRSGKEVVFIFPPMELQPKSSNVTKPVFPCFAKRKHAKNWYLTGSMRSISQHAVIRRYRME